MRSIFIKRQKRLAEKEAAVNAIFENLLRRIDSGEIAQGGRHE